MSIKRTDNIHEALEKVAFKMTEQQKAMLGLPVAGALAGGSIYSMMGGAGSLPLKKRILKGMGRGGAIGVAASALVGIGEMLNRADPSGRSMETIVKLAPAAIAMAGAHADTRKKD